MITFHGDYFPLSDLRAGDSGYFVSSLNIGVMV